MKHVITFTTLTAVLFIGTGVTRAQQPTAPERVAALKTSLAASQAALKHYAWIEATVVSLNGEVKSTKQMRNYYGADGALQKVEVSASPAPAAKPGVRGRIVANKTAELTGYMKSAVALVKTYVPPTPAKIQAAKDAGKVAIVPSGKSALLNFSDYEKPGDTLGVNIDLATNRLLGVTVSTYLDGPTDAVMMVAHMSQLPDGTSYASDITLNAQAKGLTVSVKNSGYQKSN
jgi:hypothetical protein